MPDEAAFLGFDPGGKDGFGVAIISMGQAEFDTVGSVRAAIKWAKSRCDARKPVAAGIDTLLHWADGEAGWRPADKRLKKAYHQVSKSVVSPNGLYGSMAIGGMALAIRLREIWHDIELCETHPKVLYFELTGTPYPAFEKEDGSKVKKARDLSAVARWLSEQCGLGNKRANEHELDAVMSAWAVREAKRNGWPDIVGPHDGLIFPVGSVSYRWPRVI